MTALRVNQYDIHRIRIDLLDLLFPPRARCLGAADSVHRRALRLSRENFAVDHLLAERRARLDAGIPGIRATNPCAEIVSCQYGRLIAYGI
ncbi:hypothetical protein BN2475_720045 [Paraburkholderia ribeironis]|uniref:Uncharacterized protein n=1 Tax=Paraburkholderia ribeironis TaxID=1247936 RepID=A0A1N7SK17_9BURK|nr:hypothetical protein BN2475_720045 [Paraburkholderia ribeironis]